MPVLDESNIGCKKTRFSQSCSNYYVKLRLLSVNCWKGSTLALLINSHLAVKFLNRLLIKKKSTIQSFQLIHYRQELSEFKLVHCAYRNYFTEVHVSSYPG